MNTAEGTGRTVEEAVERALRELGLVRSDVDVEVLQEPKPALLGLGGREARVRVIGRPTANDLCREFATTVLGFMGYPGTVDAVDMGGATTATLKGGEMSGLIGHHGRTLDSFEFLMALHVTRRLGRRVPVVLDAAGYRARREKSLLDTARQASDRAVAEGKAIALEPMEPRDRRIVHLALAEDARVRTTSEGEDETRHVVVIPREAESPS